MAGDTDTVLSLHRGACSDVSFCGENPHDMNMKDIHPLTLQHKDQVTSFLERDPPVISELTFANLYVWRRSRPIWVVELKDTLVFLVNGDEQNKHKKIIFGSPVGSASLIDVQMQLQDSVAGAIRLPEKDALLLSKIGQSIFEDQNNSDYVYGVQDLTDLQGRKYTKKRNHINQCLTRYNCKYEPITSDNLKECIDMQERWCGLKKCSETPGLCGEFLAIMDSFQNYDAFNLIGGAIRVEGEIQAFALGEKLTPDTAVWHFEKALPDIRGLAQLINKWFAQYSLQQFTYVNREQDLGIPGLRQAKESYYPHHMVTKFNSMSKPPSSNRVGCV